MSTGWNFTIDDSSSYITYYPFEDGGLDNRTQVGWEPYWSESGGFPTEFANDVLGQSWHITALDGAGLVFQFYGDAFYLHGTTGGTFDLSIDDTTHNLTAHFTSGSGQSMQFDLANVTYTFTNGSNTPLEVVYDNTNTSALQYTGQWSVASASGVPSPTSMAPYHQTTQYGSAVSMDFTGGEAVAVYGFRDWGNWLYNVTLDGAQYQFNGSTPWKQGNSLLFFQAGLDPSQTHTIMLSDVADNTYWQLMLNSLSVFQARDTSQGGADVPTSTTSFASPGHTSSAGSAVSSGTSAASNIDTSKSVNNAGAVAGGVVGGVGGALLLGALLFWLFRRRPAAESRTPRFPIIPDSPSDEYSKNSCTPPSAGPASLPPVAPGMYYKGAIIYRPTPQILVTAPGSVLSTDGPSWDPSMSSPGSTAHADQSELTSSASMAALVTSPLATQTVSVDRIIELIAERIDRRASPAPLESGSPPRYPEHAV